MLKHFKNYELGKHDCWSLIVDIFKDEAMVDKTLDLPKFPHFTKEEKPNFEKEMLDTIILKKLDKPKKGAVIHLNNNHIGYCLDDKKFIHRLEKLNTRVDFISDWEKRIIGVYNMEGIKPR